MTPCVVIPTVGGGTSPLAGRNREVPAARERRDYQYRRSCRCPRTPGRTGPTPPARARPAWGTRHWVFAGTTRTASLRAPIREHGATGAEGRSEPIPLDRPCPNSAEAGSRRPHSIDCESRPHAGVQSRVASAGPRRLSEIQRLTGTVCLDRCWVGRMRLNDWSSPADRGQAGSNVTCHWHANGALATCSARRATPRELVRPRASDESASPYESLSTAGCSRPARCSRRADGPSLAPCALTGLSDWSTRSSLLARTSRLAGRLPD